MYHGAGGAVQHELAYQHEHAASPSPLALDAVLELNGEWHDRQRVAGGVDPSSGGNVVYLSPGVRLSGDKWSTFVSFGVPVITNLYGTQAEPDYRVISGVTVRY